MSDQKWVSEEFNGSWDDVPTEYVPPRESIYRGTVVLSEKSPTKEGKPQIRVDVKGEYDMVLDEECKAFTSKYNNALVTQGDGGFRLAQLAKSAEVALPSNSHPDSVQELCENLLGQTVYFRTRNEEGKDRSGNLTGRINVKVARYLTEEQAQEAASAMSEAAAQ